VKAVLISRYGPPEVLRIGEVDIPSPGKGEVRVRVHAATVCAGDVRIRRADPFFLRLVGGGLLRPTRVRTPGMEFAGVIDALGEGVSGLSIGDAVFGSAGLKFGANAQYVCAPAVLVAAKPAQVAFEAAAPMAFGGISALYYLKAAGLRAGQTLLIYGASGAVGTAAVQIAKHLGANVTAVCGARNADLVRALGADAVLDYATDDFSRDGPVYDVVFDTVGKSRIRRGLRALKPGGAYVFAASSLTDYLAVSLIAALTGRLRVVGGIARGAASELAFLMQLVTEGRFKPVIEGAYPLSDIVAAHTHVEGGHKTGNVVILVD
jgi:NADPH:quinone reductase-like Zn-dependent oxidoreductase